MEKIQDSARTISCHEPRESRSKKYVGFDLKDVRNKHFVASSIKDLFGTIESHKIIDFIKETRFYKQL